MHQLTGVKGAINNSSIKFFECKVQTSEDTAVHAVYYSPEKRLPPPSSIPEEIASKNKRNQEKT